MFPDSPCVGPNPSSCCSCGQQGFLRYHFPVEADALLRVISCLILRIFMPLKCPSNPLKGFVTRDQRSWLMTCPFAPLKGILFSLSLSLFFSYVKRIVLSCFGPSPPPPSQSSMMFIYLDFTLCYQQKSSTCSHKTQEVPEFKQNINITVQSKVQMLVSISR